MVMLSCKDEPQPGPQPGVLNESSQFAECNRALSACLDGPAAYCLFGFKWGQTNSFTPTGFGVGGPREPGGQISFSFQEENGLINTHAQINLPSKSFTSLPSCAKDEIRKALKEWEAVANIAFEELPENSQSDIRFFVADIRQSGIGYPNYPSLPCNSIAGNVVIQSGVRFNTCDSFHDFLLHEIGHVLGLGHVNSQNIMSPDFIENNISGLQAGDIQGIIELYSEK